MSFDNKFTRHGYENVLLTSRGLPSNSTYVLKAEPGKLNRPIKRREPGILFISLPMVSLHTSDYDVFFEFCVDSASFKKCNIIMT